VKKRGHECYHCKRWVEEGEAHDCWTTTESALTRELSEDLQDAYERLRETAAEFGDQRIYASHKSIMFSRKSCYFFVRPRKTHLELCVFLGRPLKTPHVRRVERSSKTKVANLIRVTHRDEVEAPITDWLREAYDYAQPDLKVQPTPAAPPKKPHSGGQSRTDSREIAEPTEIGKKKAAKDAPSVKSAARSSGRPRRAPRGTAGAGRVTARRRPARARTPRGRSKGRGR